MREPDTTASRKGKEEYVKKSNKKHIHNTPNTIHSQEIVQQIE